MRHGNFVDKMLVMGSEGPAKCFAFAFFVVNLQDFRNMRNNIEIKQ